MSHSTSPLDAIAAHPDPRTGDCAADFTRSSLSPTESSSSSVSSCSSESELPPLQSSRHSTRRSRSDRPRMSERQKSSTIIVPKGREVQRDVPHYPPDDARAMSPRRNSQDIEKLEHGIRQSLKEQARSLQSSLAALAEKIDEVKLDHDKLENENRFLQDYIGGLTRTMSKDNSLGRSSSTSGKKKGKR